MQVSEILEQMPVVSTAATVHSRARAWRPLGGGEIRWSLASATASIVQSPVLSPVRSRCHSAIET